jgi:hypothetical protein
MNFQRASPSDSNAGLLFLLLVAFALVLGGCGDESASGGGSTVDSDALVDLGSADLGALDAGAGDGSRSDDAAIDGATDTAVDADVDAEVDRSDEVYERSRLLEVTIDMDPGDLAALRVQRRPGLEIIAPECALPPAPYTWFPARVTVDDEVFEEVGVRKKGFFGSVSESKPSFKVKFDKYDDDQTYLDMKRLTLNNSRQDPSFVKQCLAYDLFREAGIPAPRCNFAHVVLNGEDMGVYVNVESLKKPFVRRNFADNDGNLYEGTLSDFRENWTGTIKQKTNEDDPDSRAIDALSAALELPDEQLLDALRAVIDLDQFLTFWAMEIMVAHWDGYSGNTNNFHFYDDPTSGLLHFIPWGTDGTFAPPILFFEGRRPAPRTVNAAGLLCRRLYLHPEGQRLYLDRLSALMDTHWDIIALEASIEEMAQVFGVAVPGERLEAVWQGLSQVISFLGDQETQIRRELAGEPVEWTVGLRGGLCQEQAGDAEGSFETTWGSWPTEDTFQTGTGEVSVNLFEQEWDIRSVGAAFGRNGEDPGAAQLIIPLLLGDQQLFFLSFLIPRGAVTAGAVFDFSEVQNNCSFNRYDTRTRRVDGIATCQSGTLTIEQGETRDGTAVGGRFDVGLWSSRR